MKVSKNEWVLANLNVSGYFRVNYDLGNWDRLLSQLDSNHEVLHKNYEKEQSQKCKKTYKLFFMCFLYKGDTCGEQSSDSG